MSIPCVSGLVHADGASDSLDYSSNPRLAIVWIKAHANYFIMLTAKCAGIFTAGSTHILLHAGLIGTIVVLLE